MPETRHRDVGPGCQLSPKRSTASLQSRRSSSGSFQPSKCSLESTETNSHATPKKEQVVRQLTPISGPRSMLLKGTVRILRDQGAQKGVLRVRAAAQLSGEVMDWFKTCAETRGYSNGKGRCHIRTLHDRRK